MVKVYLYICLIVICASCAQISPLTGGKKDELPPKATKFVPQNSSLNFNSKSIEITFDEYIVLKDIINQFIITPQTKTVPNIQASGKKLKVTFAEDLLPNTTYKLSFGNAIVDLHESNAISNFEYVFSTGNTIDSLKLKGKIVDYADLNSSKSFLVGLYSRSENDSVVFKSKPLYVSKTNKEGFFYFDYLPNNRFILRAINDKNKNLVYDGADEEIAFSDSIVNTADTTIINLISFKEVSQKSFIKKSTNFEVGKALVVYNKPQLSVNKVDGINIISYEQSKTKDSLFIYYNNLYDTLNARIIYSEVKIDTVLIKLPQKPKTTTGLKNKSKYVITCNCSSQLSYLETIQLNLNFPINTLSIQTDSIYLFEKKDSTKIKIPFKINSPTSLSTNLFINAAIKPQTNYELQILKGSFKDELVERKNDSIVFKFSTTSPDDYSKLNLKLIVPQKENYIIMLLDENKKVVNQQIIEFSLASSAEKIIEFKNLKPSNYTVKAVLDKNKNNIFDTGDYIKNHQPEKVFILSTPIKVLLGWETEQEWLVK